MRRLLTTALLTSFALPLVASAARAADYDYPYEPGPPRAYERPVEAPPVFEERPEYRAYDRPYVRSYARPFYGRPDYDDGPYWHHRHHFRHYGYEHRYGGYGYAPY